MGAFSADWLALREPYDLRARSPVILDAVASFFARRTPIRIVDLACGTGSTLRALASRLPARQSWTLIDHDADLLAHAASTPTAEDVAVAIMRLDLNHDLDAALEGAVDLVVTSALLDLVSEAWLHRLAAALTARAIPFYAALSYDGRVAFAPPDPFDATIIDAVNAHQRTDKGFGPALGPAAANVVPACLTALGYSVVAGASDWAMGPADRDIQTELLCGWARAAHDIEDLSADEIAAWLTRRRSMIADGRSSCLVGHVDLFAAPSTTR